MRHKPWREWVPKQPIIPSKQQPQNVVSSSRKQSNSSVEAPSPGLQNDKCFEEITSWGDPLFQEKLLKSLSVSSLLPIPPIPIPKCVSIASSKRMKERSLNRSRVWRTACRARDTINRMAGFSRRRANCPMPQVSQQQGSRSRPVLQPLLAISATHQRPIQEAKRVVKLRRGFPTGVAAARELLEKRGDPESSYRADLPSVHVPIEAEKLSEPSQAQRASAVQILPHLPGFDATMYGDPKHCLRLVGKSKAAAAAIRRQYGFINGDYFKYFFRGDVQELRGVVRQHLVRAVAGFSAVMKTNNLQQRKLLMACEKNYLWIDVRHLPPLQMPGGQTLCRAHVPGDSCHLWAWDEENAFTYCAVPEWRYVWQCAPPLLYKDAPGWMQSQLEGPVGPNVWVYPTYQRTNSPAFADKSEGGCRRTALLRLQI